MNRLSHNRALLLILAVLLQVGLLRGTAPARCAMSGGLHACCCAPAAQEPAAQETAAKSCCDDDEHADELAAPKRASTCRCAPDGGGEPPATTPERERTSLDAGLPCEAAWRAHLGLAATKRVALRSVPRAATGPPRHLVLQVFTI